MIKFTYGLLLDILTFKSNSKLPNIKVMLLNKLGAKVDHSAYLDIGVRPRFPHNLTIGKGTSIGADCKILSFGPIVIGQYSQISNDLILVSGTHDPISRKPLNNCRIKIGDYCWLGAGVKVIGNVEIGQGCVVGAGATVLNDLPPWTICVGTPAKPIRTLKKPSKVMSNIGIVDLDE